MNQSKSNGLTSLKLDLEPELAPKVYFNLRQSFFLGIPRVFTISAASALFLDSFDASDIPYAYLTSAFGVMLLGFLFLRIERGAGHIQAALSFIIFLGLGTMGLRVGYQEFTNPALIGFALFAWAEAEWTLSNVVFWSIANNSFTVREAKKLFGIVSAGEIIPLIVGGAIVPIFVSELGVINLLYFSILGYLAAVINLIAYRRKYLSKQPHRSAASDSTPYREGTGRSKGLRQTYIYHIAALLIFNCVLFYFVDNLFLEEAQRKLPKADDLASFMGLFVFTVGVFQLLTKVFVSSRLTKALGVRRTLSLTPATILVLMVAAFVFLIFKADSSLVFYTVVFMKLMERTLASGINNPAYYVLFQPLTQDIRNRAQGFLDTIVTQCASLIGGGLLLLIQEQLKLGPSGIAGVGLFLLLGWLLVSQKLGGEYQQALKRSIHRRQFEHSDLLNVGPEVHAVLEEGLNDPAPVKVVYSLKLLAEIDRQKCEDQYLRLLQNESKVVRSVVIDLLVQSDGQKFLRPLQQLVAQSHNVLIQRDLILGVAACAKAQSVNLLRSFLDSKTEELQDAALVGLLRYGEVEGALQASPKLTAFATSSNPNDKIRACRIIAEAGNPRLSQTLPPLLEDGNISVRRAAIFAAGKINNPELAPAILRNINVQELRGPIKNTLINLGEKVLPALIATYESKSMRWSSRYTLLRIAGRIGSDTVTPFLISTIKEGDNDLRSAALQALSESENQSQHSEEIEAIFKKLILEEARSYHELLATRRDVKLGPDLQSLVDGLAAELEKSEHRLYLLLENLYGRTLISSIQIRLRSDSKSAKALSFELLENTLHEEHRSPVVTILDAQSELEKLRQLDQFFPRIQAQDWAVALAYILSSPLAWKTTWIMACCHALSIANGIPIIGLRNEADSNTPSGTLSLMVNAGKGNESSLVQRTIQLHSIPFLKGLTMDRLGALCSSLELSEISAGQIVIPKGAIIDRVTIVLEGALECGNSEYPAGTAPGDFTIFDPKVLTEPLVATQASVIAFLRKEEVLELMTEQYGFAWHLLETACERLQPKSVVTSSRTLSNFSPLAATSLQSGPQKSVFELAMLLRAVPLFQELDDLVLSDVIYAATEVFYEPGESIFSQGKAGSSMLIILDGTVQVHSDRKVIASVSGPDIIGEISAITAFARTASVSATSTVHGLILDQIELYTLLWQQPEVILPLLKVLSGRLRQNLALGQANNPFRNDDP